MRQSQEENRSLCREGLRDRLGWQRRRWNQRYRVDIDWVLEYFSFRLISFTFEEKLDLKAVPADQYQVVWWLERFCELNTGKT